MDKVELSFYRYKYITEVSTSSGTEYQKLFERIMIRKYGTDFVKVMPWGAEGDWKCDGFLQTSKTVYQVYAPNELKAVGTILKIEKDFKGAMEKWGNNMESWTFVHNSTRGVPPQVLDKILKIKTDNPSKAISIMGPEELEKILFTLNDSFMADLYGYMPTRDDLTGIRNKDIEKVIDQISRTNVVDGQEMSPVSSRKLYVNNLSEEVRTLIKIGLTKSEAVNNYFSRIYDAKLGDQIASTFNEKYVELKTLELPPDDIFVKLQEFISNGRTMSAKEQVASLAVLTYLFERCDIFENEQKEMN